mmetsp:Transcript_10024/g.24757  ORF Transcript_10024/g.24757 Transcript_10024/m.24757 type:complete len:260 (-) Transcript_10024:992-1771(-)
MSRSSLAVFCPFIVPPNTHRRKRRSNSPARLDPARFGENSPSLRCCVRSKTPLFSSVSTLWSRGSLSRRDSLCSWLSVLTSKILSAYSCLEALTLSLPLRSFPPRSPLHPQELAPQHRTSRYRCLSDHPASDSTRSARSRAPATTQLPDPRRHRRSSTTSSCLLPSPARGSGRRNSLGSGGTAFWSARLLAPRPLRRRTWAWTPFRATTTPTTAATSRGAAPSSAGEMIHLRRGRIIDAHDPRLPSSLRSDPTGTAASC